MEPLDKNSVYVALGGVDSHATHQDGTDEPVKVRILPLNALPHYTELLQDEAGMVELFCDRPKGWAETLARDSFMQLLELGEGLNLDFLSRWTKQRKARLEKLFPGFEKTILDRALDLRNSSPASPPRPA